MAVSSVFKNFSTLSLWLHLQEEPFIGLGSEDVMEGWCMGDPLVTMSPAHTCNGDGP